MTLSNPISGQIRRGLLAHAVVRLTVETVSQMRCAPLQACGEPFAVSSLKHFDEQTLAVLHALHEALRGANLHVEPGTLPFRNWGVLAAPCYLGRSAMVPSMSRFHAEGAWGVSPHMIPYRSLHSISGTVSQYLKIHGPNYGVGGGPGGLSELLLAGFSLLETQPLPGLWLIASRIHPDTGLDDNGRPPADSSCEAIVLALVPESVVTPYVVEYTPTPTVSFEQLAELFDSLDKVPECRLLCPFGSLTFRRKLHLHGPHLSFTAMTAATGRKRL